MRFSPLFRILGTLVYGFIGWELGVALAQTPDLNTESALYIVPCTIIGGYTRDYSDLIYYQGRATWQNFGLLPYRDYWSEYPPVSYTHLTLPTT